MRHNIDSRILGVTHTILLQNAFPTLEKYIDHSHKIESKPVKVVYSIKNEILENFKQMMILKEKRY